MKPLSTFAAILLIVTTSSGFSQTATAKEKPTESPHRRGPNGLEAWTINWSVPDRPGEGPYPMTLVLSKNGHIIRRIDGDGFVWNWIFLPGGKEIAYESGPFHFGLTCIRMNIATGKRLEDYDCYHETPQPAPDWVIELEKNPPDW